MSLHFDFLESDVRARSELKEKISFKICVDIFHAMRYNYKNSRAKQFQLNCFQINY